MRDKHEPRGEFVDRLEAAVVTQARLRAACADSTPWWMPHSPLKAIAAAAGLALISMTIGGGAVAVAYQAQSNAQRDLLVESYHQRLSLAMTRLEMAKDQMSSAERRVSVGLAGEETVLEARLKLAEAEAQVRSVEMQLEEVRLTGREPGTQVSSPLVSGRDFVLERLRIEYLVPRAAIDLEDRQLQLAQKRMSLGLATSADVEKAAARVQELRAVLEGIEHKIMIRQQFLKGMLNATQADLQVLVAEAELKRKALQPKLELARKDLARVRVRFEKGLAQQIDVKEAEAALKQAELEMVVLEVEFLALQLRIKK